MATQLSTLISQELNIPINQVAGTVSLLDDGATIPFISRYRKEATGNLDELSIQTIDQRLRNSFYHDPDMEQRLIAAENSIELGQQTSFMAAHRLLEEYFRKLKN